MRDLIEKRTNNQIDRVTCNGIGAGSERVS
nr:MAG TPA: hypothetical protein [Siphoviridae sp. ctcBx5]